MDRGRGRRREGHDKTDGQKTDYDGTDGGTNGQRTGVDDETDDGTDAQTMREDDGTDGRTDRVITTTATGTGWIRRTFPDTHNKPSQAESYFTKKEQHGN